MAAGAVSSAISDENIADVRATGAGAMNASAWEAARATLRTTAETFILFILFCMNNVVMRTTKKLSIVF